MRSAAAALLLLGTTDGASLVGNTSPFADLFSRRLASARRAEEAAASAPSATNATPAVCPEGYDDDAALAANNMAAQYGITSCGQAHELLLNAMGNDDLLCKSLGVNICNCTCAGTIVEPSTKVAPVPLDETVALAPPRETTFDCSDVRSDSGDGNARLLPARTRGWNCHELGAAGVLLWNVEGDEGTIAFAAEFVSAGGGAGVGVSANGGMYGADLLWVGRRVAEGAGAAAAEEEEELVVRDMFSRGYSEGGDLVTVDDSQDATLEWSEEGGGRLAFVVSRPVKPCDRDDDLEIPSGPVPIVWARFPGHGHMYHGPGQDDRGTVYLDLMNPHVDAIPETSSDLFTVDLRMGDGDDRYSLEDDQVNTYACRSFELPSDRPYHIVSYEPIRDTVPSTSNVVHHIVLYSCDEDPSLPDPHQCSAMAASCFSVEIAWAVGMPTQYLPPVAGLPMKRYVYMEMHYENLGRTRGIRDGSGLRLTFTPELREQDFGYLIVGTNLGREEPLEPGEDEIVRSGFCSAECLARHLPASGVQVHAQFFHAHLAGRSLRTQHFRDGEELPHLGDMPYYDFNHQFFKSTSHETHLLPGDELVTSCSYSTLGHDEPIPFGLETQEEMCFNIIGLYPMIDLKFCWNSTDSRGWCGREGMIEDGIHPSTPYVEPIPERCLEGMTQEGADDAVPKVSDDSEPKAVEPSSGVGQLCGHLALFMVILVQAMLL